MFAEIMSLACLLSAIYALTTSSGIISERSGVVNIGLNAYLIAGALGSLLAHGMLGYGAFGNWSLEGSFWIDLVGMIFGALFGIIISWIFSLVTITWKGDHVIAGTAMNILLPALAFVFLFMNSQNTFTTPDNSGYVIIAKKTTGFDIKDFVYLLIAAMVCLTMWFVIRYTKIGLRIWASGENPNALASSGVNVHRTRYIAQLFAGALGGIAGAMYLKFVNGNFTGGVDGIGFIAIAMLVIGQWRIQWAFLVAVIFSIIQASLVKENITIKALIGSPEFIKFIPYVLPLIVLPFFKKVTNMPKHDGLIYDQSKR